ncbi:hypothetical protein D9M71_734180 [compost metagenome]
MSVFVKAQVGPKVAVPCIGMKHLEIDPQGLHENVLYAKAGQFIGHDPARCQYPVEVSVELADIGLDVWRDPIAHSIAG